MPSRRDHRHVAGQAVGFALVDIEDPRLVRTAGTDDLGGQRLVEVFLLKVEHRLQALTLARVLEQGRLLQAQPVDGLLRGPVLLADMAQVDVALPEPAHTGLGVLDDPFDRGNDGIGPQTDETDAGAVDGIERSVSGIGAAHLHRQPDDLDQQQSQQHQQVAIADEEGFHEAVISGQ